VTVEYDRVQQNKDAAAEAGGLWAGWFLDSLGVLTGVGGIAFLLQGLVLGGILGLVIYAHHQRKPLNLMFIDI
jgi:hypothetical protein